MALEHQLHTKLDIKGLQEALSKSFKVEISHDPGRYLCNYIYFKSAHDLSLPNEHCSSLFIHFPVLQLSPHHQNIRFVEKLFDILLKPEIK